MRLTRKQAGWYMFHDREPPEGCRLVALTTDEELIFEGVWRDGSFYAHRRPRHRGRINLVSWSYLQ